MHHPQNGTPDLSLKAGQPALQKLLLPRPFHSTGRIYPTWQGLAGPGRETPGPQGILARAQGRQREGSYCPFWKGPQLLVEAWSHTCHTPTSPLLSLWGHRALREPEPEAGRPIQPGVSSFTGRRPIQGPGLAQTGPQRWSFNVTTPTLFIFCRLLFPRTPWHRLGKPLASPLREWEETPGPGEAPVRTRCGSQGSRKPGALSGQPRPGAQRRQRHLEESGDGFIMN